MVTRIGIKFLARLSAEKIALSNYLYLTQFLTDLGQILDSKSYDQA